MGGLKEIFTGMATIMANAENTVSRKITETVNAEQNQPPPENGGDDDATAGAAETSEGLKTAGLIELQYDVQKFGIFNNMTTNTMQSVAGAYQSIAGNLNFR